MLRSGDQQAAALRASGEAKARAVSQIGADAAGTIGAFQQERRDAPVRALQLQNLQNETALGDAKVAAVRRAKIGQDVLATAVQRFGDDPGKVAKFLGANGFSELIEGYAQTQDLMTKIRKGAIADQDSANAFEGEILSRIAKLPTPDAKQAAWTAAQGSLKAHRIDTSSLSPTWDDAQAQQQIALYGPKPELMNVPAGGAVIDKNAPTGAPVFTAPPRETPVSLQSVNRLVSGKPMTVNFNPRTGKYTDQAGAELQNVQPIPPASQQQSGAGLDPDAVDYTATQYRILGPSGIPTRIETADRVKILNTAAKQAKALGQTPAVAVQRQAAFKSDASALTKMRTMSSAAESFETKAVAQAGLVAELSAKVSRTQWPIINRAIVAGEMNIAGDENASKLVNAITTFSAEYAKIMEGSTGSVAASSDSSRKAADKLISAAMNQKTLPAVLNQMQWEMRQTVQGYGIVIEHITERMGGTLSPPSALAPAAGMIRARDSQGVLHEAQAGTPLPAGWTLEK